MSLPNSMKHPLVRCGPYLSHILTLAPKPGKTWHTHMMLTKLSTATVTFHKRAYFLHSARCAPSETKHTAPQILHHPVVGRNKKAPKLCS